MRISELVGRRRIDLNVDIGEGFPFDEELLRYASSANICCGEHAGSYELTLATIALCERHRVRIGVHPGYPDRTTLGRASMEPVTQRTYLNSLFAQTKRFLETCRPAYLKPHGAFYNDTAFVLPEDWDAGEADHPERSRYESGGIFLAQHPGAQSLAMMLRIHKLPLMGLPLTAHEVIAGRSGQKMLREGFADRRYKPDGTLVSRSESGAVLTDEREIRAQVLDLAARVDTICLHGDTPDCVEHAEMVAATLAEAGFEVGY